VNLWLLQKCGFTSATLEAIGISEDAGSDQALHLPSEVCVTVAKKALEGTYPMFVPPAQKPDPQGCAVSFKLPFFFFFLVESTVDGRSQRGWFYLKVL